MEEFDFKIISYESFDKYDKTYSTFSFQGIKYEIMYTNGFLRLYTEKGRAYWISQNLLKQTSPDWKFHVSVCPNDIRLAWNLISTLFLNKKGKFGIKVNLGRKRHLYANGREITIYIFKYVEDYENLKVAKEANLNKNDEDSEEYWLNFVEEIQNLLKDNSIKSNGLAKGDFPLNEYVSIRNESFVSNNKGIYSIPSDEMGWNVAKHILPFKIPGYIETNKDNKIQYLLLFSVVVLILSVLSYMLK